MARNVPAASGPAWGPPPNRRVKVPTVLQMEAVECGAAALASVLAYHGRFVPLEELRFECGVSRDGSKASNVLRAARKYGLKARGYKREIDDLYELEYPSILFWNLNHFVVLEGFSRGRARLNDPATGPRTVAMEELDGAFSGVVLTFEPGPRFEKGGKKRSLPKALRRRLRGSEAAFAFVVLCGLFLVVPGLVVPTFARFFIDEYLVAGRGPLVKPLLIGMALTAAVRMALTWLQRHTLLRFETKLALTTSAHFFQHVLRLPITYFSQRFAGEIGSRVLINDRVAHLVSGKLATTLLDCFLVVFYLSLMLSYDGSWALWPPPMTPWVVLIAALNFLALKLAARRRTDAARRLLQDEGKLTGIAMNGLAMIETLKATGSEPEFFERWAGHQVRALKARQELAFITQLVSAAPPLVFTLSTAGVLYLGSLKVMAVQLTIGELVAYQTLMASFLSPLTALVGFGSSLQELQVDLNRLDDVIANPQDVRYTPQAGEREAPRRKVKLSGRIEVRDLTFGYSPLDEPLIEGFHLELNPGQRVALVGRSGSGKSTIARLIVGLYEPWDGEILFDGIPRQQLPAELICNSLAFVDQEIFLFSGTVRENVTMWDQTIPRVTSACKDAAIDDVIESRQGSYRSAVAEAGANFSGGERQRLEIARALVGHPTMLILDEATSALDPATEEVVGDGLRRRGCSCIIVAHRLSTIRDSDEIVVLERGKIVQRGTHDEMKDLPGPYAELIRE